MWSVPGYLAWVGPRVCESGVAILVSNSSRRGRAYELMPVPTCHCRCRAPPERPLTCQRVVGTTGRREAPHLMPLGDAAVAALLTLMPVSHERCPEGPSPRSDDNELAGWRKIVSMPTRVWRVGSWLWRLGTARNGGWPAFCRLSRRGRLRRLPRRGQDGGDP
jgi:hypothetical protein